jgi:hypothetical protein
MGPIVTDLRDNEMRWPRTLRRCDETNIHTLSTSPAV